MSITRCDPLNDIRQHEKDLAEALYGKEFGRWCLKAGFIATSAFVLASPVTDLNRIAESVDYFGTFISSAVAVTGLCHILDGHWAVRIATRNLVQAYDKQFPTTYQDPQY